ncbi:MAG: hypothetical protein VX684_12445, partial [Planctomycetota bacterium]|nr:hypothetical protein [Planctomycetota bacterium]
MRIHERSIPGLKIPASLAISVVALVTASTFMIGSMMLVVGSLTESSVEAEEANVVARLLSNNTVMDRAEDRFNGRSIFYIPREPVRNRPAPPRPPAPRTVAPPPPP